MKYELSQRLKKLPPYLFAEIDNLKNKLKKQKIPFIDLSIGDPDILAPSLAVEKLYQAAKLKENQKYALDAGSFSLKKAIGKWMRKRFSVKLNSDEEILPLIGSKEGLVHFPLGVVNRGDYCIIPSPGYPGYRGAATLVGAKIYELPLLEENAFLPDLERIPLSVRNKAKLIYLNYPNNPTTVLANSDFLKKLVKFSQKYNIIICYDNAYSEIYFNQKPKSILEIPEAKEVAIEFHSFSKTFSMTGFRLGWAAGNKDLIKILLKVKTNIDSGIFAALQEAGASILEKENSYVVNLRKIFKQRRDIFLEGLKKLNFFKELYAEGTFYVWAKLPPKHFSIEFCRLLLKKTAIVATPGVGFGKYGEGFVRFALCKDKCALEEALSKLSHLTI